MYQIGRTSAEAERTHLRVGPTRAQCGTVLDADLGEEADRPPTCATCQRYAKMGRAFRCGACGMVYHAPLQVVELRHLCQDGRSRPLMPLDKAG